MSLTSTAKDRLLKWALMGANSIPDLTMAQAATGLTPAQLRAGYFAAPKSLGDFGRCYELMQAVPELRAEFPVIVNACPEFEPVLNAWDELAGLFVSNREACYARLRELTSTETVGQGTWDAP